MDMTHKMCPLLLFSYFRALSVSDFPAARMSAENLSQVMDQFEINQVNEVNEKDKK
ncbi:MAG: hypothetical protein HY818_01975 [Acetobacterium woodii]|nr:hypothetical protein [Acetobacterium woodii]